MIRIGIAGGRGFVGQELFGLLDGIADYRVVFLGSNSRAGEPVASHFECDTDLCFQSLSTPSIRNAQVDAWVIAQPNGAAEEFVSSLQDDAAKVIDVSSDFRFEDRWCYGLAEANEQQVRLAKRVSNPGCYATAAQLALLPVCDSLAGVPSVFGISGYSGAGKTPNDRNDPSRLNNNLLPYKLSGHTHELEISRHLNTDVRFAPHVASFFRGISVTVFLELKSGLSVQELTRLFEEYYQRFPLVGIQSQIPEIKDVINTNRAIIGGFTVDERNPKRVTLIGVIDNLRRGAASQVVQNLNCMFGMPVEHGLM